ncbi:MAG: methyltransferase domain-containing protein [Chloroflexota bacterium]
MKKPGRRQVTRIRNKGQRKTQPVPPVRPAYPTHSYYVHTMPGLEKLTWREIESHLPEAMLLEIQTKGQQNGLVIFQYKGNPKSLLSLRTVEDVFLVVASAETLPESRTALAGLAAMVDRQVSWAPALKLHRDATGFVPKRGAQTTFRVISRLHGFHPFHRKEAQSRVEKAIQKANPRWFLARDHSVLEFWLNLFAGEAAIVGLRLSDITMRQRTYKRETIPASLRPSVATSMVLLSEPKAGDIFLDPMCGAGTILIERALWGDYQHIIGGDIRNEVVHITELNARAAKIHLPVYEWDATELPSLDEFDIAQRQIDKVVCNLPFGKQIGSPAANARLYRNFLAEMSRVVKPFGRLVLLTGDHELLRHELQQSDAFRILNVIRFWLLGTKAKIFVVQRTG